MTHWQIRTDWRHAMRRRALASSFAAMLIIAGGIGHALAQEADEDDDLPDAKFFKGMLHGLGLKKDGERSGINYQERAPLVVPPTRDLPPPKAVDPATKNALWPMDQDEKRRKEEAARRKKEARTFTWESLSRQMSPQELKKGATTAKDEALSKRSADNPEAYQQQSTPSQLGYTGGLFGSMKNFFSGNNQPESTTFEVEPPRVSLTDPPSGYRSPSPTQPYGVGPEDKNPKAMTQEDRVNMGTGSQTK